MGEWCQAVKQMINPSWKAPGLGPAVICCRVKPQAHNPQCTWLDIDEYLPHGGVQNRWVAFTADPMTSYGLMTSSGGMVMINGGLLSSGSFPCRACMISMKPGRGHRGLSKPWWHHLLGWSGGCIHLCGGSRLAFISGCQHGPPWVGLATLAVTTSVAAIWVGVLWNGLHLPGQAHLHAIGWCCGCEDTCLCEWDQLVYYPLEFHHTFCQTARLPRDWWLGLLSPIL